MTPTNGAHVAVKTCSTCREELPVDCFSRRGQRLRSQCKPCVNAGNKRSRETKRARDPGAYSALYSEYNRRVRQRRGPEREAEFRRKYRLKRYYGLTPGEFDAMISAQGGLCASCREEPATAIDHDHSTGKVRAILCSGCNTGLGQFAEDPRRLEMAAAYLRRHANA